MINKLLGAAAMAAVILAVAPASAAKIAKVAGCSGPNLEKAQTTLDAIPDGDSKLAAEKEIVQAQDALLAGKMGVCAVHLSKAMQAETMK
jgi:hypothetical protein